jgi:hypothetical protein
MVMPALLWIAFWSSIMGVAACWEDALQPIQTDTPDKRDLPSRN